MGVDATNSGPTMPAPPTKGGGRKANSAPTIAAISPITAPVVNLPPVGEMVTKLAGVEEQQSSLSAGGSDHQEEPSHPIAEVSDEPTAPDAEAFQIRETATSPLNDEAIPYPDNWDLSTGIAEEIWQAILIYLEERYGDQKNKSIRAQVYPEDIHNLRLLSSKFPDRTAAKIWLDKLTTQKVVKPRRAAPDTVVGSTGGVSSNTAFHDASFSAPVETPKPISTAAPSTDDVASCALAISSLSASQIFIYFRDKKIAQLHEESLKLLKEKWIEETDPDEANILLKAINIFGGLISNFKYFLLARLWTI